MSFEFEFENCFNILVFEIELELFDYELIVKIMVELFLEWLMVIE